eukprot:g473.t1
MDMIADPLFYLVAVPAVLVAGISKGGFGGGLGIVAVPMLALAIGPVQAAAIMLPILCAMDVFGLIAYRRRADWTNLLRLVPGAMIGILIGAVTFRWFDADAVRLTIGLIAVLFTLQHWTGFGPRRPADRPPGPSHLRGGAWGSVAGFTSFVAHAGGPPVQFYLLPQKIDKTLYVGTTVWFFFAVNYVKLVPYTMLGLFSAENLATGSSTASPTAF